MTKCRATAEVRVDYDADVAEIQKLSCTRYADHLTPHGFLFEGIGGRVKVQVSR